MKNLTSKFLAFGLVVALAACTSTAVVTLVPQDRGDIGKGEAERNGAMFVQLNGKLYEGEFSSMRDSSTTTSGTAFGSAYGTGGYANATASSTAYSQSNTGGGSAYLRSVDGDVIRCKFRFENQGFGGTAIGVCTDTAGANYDMTMRVR